MAGLNTTGNSAPKDYVLGRGKVYFANLVGDLPDAYRFLGNAPDFNITVEVETLEHQSSRSGLKVTDAEVTISQKVSLSLSLDEMNFRNLALFFSGASGAKASVNGETTMGAVKQLNSATQNIVPGRWYDCLDTNGDRVYHIDSGATVLVQDQSANAATVDVDYTLDRAMGRIFVIATSSVLTSADTGLEWQVTGNTATVVEEVQALTTGRIEGALKFISSNPGDDDHFTEYQFHKVSLKADGDFGLISDEVTTMQLTGVAEANATAGGAGSPTMTVTTHAEATASPA
jgi:hypothetical protein